MTNEPSNLPVPTDPATLFHFDESRPSFESLARENGFRHWSARDLMGILGYSEWKSFRLVVNKAIGVCTRIGVPVDENIKRHDYVADARTVEDFAVSKFACYLIAMNGDPKKPEVARAQAYFAAIAEGFQKYIESAEDVERVDVRSEIRDKEQTLCGIAQSHGVEHYAFFQNAGYRGLYNRNLNDLRAYKGDPSKGKKPLLDFMGKRELAANLFRITETEAKIQNEDVRGQRGLETAAYQVGQSVRATMTASGGPLPEDLPLTTDIASIQGDLKRTVKGLKAADADRDKKKPAGA